MDGARFANAIATLGVTPAEMTWKAGVSVLSLGTYQKTERSCATRSSSSTRRRRPISISGESVPARPYRRTAFWRLNSLPISTMATGSISHVTPMHWQSGFRTAWPSYLAYACHGRPRANAVFAVMPRKLDNKLRDAGVRYLEWGARLASLKPDLGLRPGRWPVFLVLLPRAMKKWIVFWNSVSSIRSRRGPGQRSDDPPFSWTPV